jgi:hypothetical protein
VEVGVNIHGNEKISRDCNRKTFNPNGIGELNMKTIAFFSVMFVVALLLGIGVVASTPDSAMATENLCGHCSTVTCGYDLACGPVDPSYPTNAIFRKYAFKPDPIECTGPYNCRTALIGCGECPFTQW